MKDHTHTAECPSLLCITFVNFKSKFHFLRNFSVINENHVFDRFDHVVFVYKMNPKGQRSSRLGMRTRNQVTTSALQIFNVISIKKHENKENLTVKKCKKDGILKKAKARIGKTTFIYIKTRLLLRKCNVYERSFTFYNHHDQFDMQINLNVS